MDVGDIEAVEQARARLAALGRRLRHAQGSPGALITAALGGPVPDTPADRTEFTPGPPAPPLTTRAVIEAEREVLSVCLSDPILAAELLGWLTPDDFSRPEHCATWSAFAALTQAGTPVDYVTLARACQRHHPGYDSPGLGPDQLVTMARQTPGLPTPAVRTVAHASLLRHTDAAHHHVRTMTQDHTASALTVVSAAEKAYREAGEHARRLTGPHTTPGSRISAALDPIPPGPPPHPPGPAPHDPPHLHGPRHHR